MRKILIYSILLVFNLVHSQEFKLGKVSIEELKETHHPKDSSAVAAILFKTGMVNFIYSENAGFEILTTVRTRIKIYKKEGYDYANFVKHYQYSTNNKETVSFSDAITYNLVNGEIEKTKLKNDGIFEEKINKFWKEKKITMPNIKEGSVIEYEYTTKSPSLGIIDEWEFQTDIPVNYSEFQTAIPEYFTYSKNQKGFLFPKVVEEKKNKSISFTNKERSGGHISSTTFSNDKVDYIETNTIYSVIDIPAMKDETYVNNIKNYTSSISHELSMVKYPNQVPKIFSTDWEKVVKTIYDSEDFGAELNKTGYFEDDLNVILSGISKREEKIMTIFSFVKSKVKWDKYYGYFCNEGVRKAYKEGTGNVAEINLMLTTMLRFAGIKANPVLVSTRSNGISYFPNLTAFNYVICAIEIENSLLLLDATEKYSLPNILPIRDLNWFGRLIRDNGSSVHVELTPNFTSKEVFNLLANINSDGIIEGQVREQHLDYNALNFRERYSNISEESRLEKLEKSHENIEILEYKVTGKEELDLPVVETYTFKDNKCVEVIGGKMYFSPLLFFVQSQNPFKQEKREYPVDFIFPNQDKYLINISIPEGYVVESMPQTAAFKTNFDHLVFKYSITNNQNKIQVVLTFDINTSILQADFYDELKFFYDEIVKKENEKVILKKI